MICLRCLVSLCVFLNFLIIFVLIFIFYFYRLSKSKQCNITWQRNHNSFWKPPLNLSCNNQTILSQNQNVHTYRNTASSICQGRFVAPLFCDLLCCVMLCSMNLQQKSTEKHTNENEN